MEYQKMTFTCECCNYKCSYLSHWKQHIESEKHKNNGIRKERSDKILEPICKFCNYKTINLRSMKTHILTHHLEKDDRKKEFKYYCDKCDFGTFGEILFIRHCETNKHKINTQNI